MPRRRAQLLANHIPHNPSISEKVPEGLEYAAQVANIGIVIEIISRWWPAIMTIGAGILHSLTIYADPIIYCLRGLKQLYKFIHRSCLGLPFEDDPEEEPPKSQAIAELASLGFFVLAVIFFTGCLISGPVGVTIAWLSGLAGLLIVGKYEYAYQEKLAKERYEDACDNLKTAINHSDKSVETQKKIIALREERDRAYQDYQDKSYSKKLYFGLIFGLFFLLVCGSASVFAPPFLAPVLFYAAKVASLYLACINIGRFTNFVHSQCHTKPTIPDPDVEKELTLQVGDRTNSSTGKTLQTFQDEKARNPDRQSTLNQDEKKCTHAPAFGLSIDQVKTALARYTAYKKSKYFSVVHQHFFTSKESIQITQALAVTLATPGSDHVRGELVEAYLNEKKNIGKAFYNIISETVKSASFRSSRRR